MPSNTDETLITDVMLRSVQLRLLSKARQLAPQHIAPFLNTENVTIEQRKDGYSIVMRLIPKEGLTEDVRAQEFGSGTRKSSARKGFKSKHEQPDGYIKIVPKRKSFLTFYWERAGKVVRRSEVLHPGIYAFNSGKGYMREALVQSKDKIVEEIGKEATENLKLKVRAIFSRPGGQNK